MCTDCCLCRTCCCGRDLANGVFSWAVLDILFHLLLFPLPLLMTNIFYYASKFIIWIVIVILADIIAIFGERGRRPPVLAFWQIIFGVNIAVLFLMWVAIGLTVYFMEFTDISVSSYMAIRSLDEIWNDDRNLTVVCISLFLLVIMPFSDIYYWLVVRSLRRRLEMERSIGYNDDRLRVVTVEEKADYMRRKEAQEEQKRKQEMMMAMAVLVSNMRKGEKNSNGSQLSSAEHHI